MIEDLPLSDRQTEQRRRLGASRWGLELEAWGRLLRPKLYPAKPADPEKLVISFGRHKGRKVSNLSDGYLSWLAGLPDLRELLNSSVKAEIDRRRKKNPPE